MAVQWNRHCNANVQRTSDVRERHSENIEGSVKLSIQLENGTVIPDITMYVVNQLHEPVILSTLGTECTTVIILNLEYAICRLEAVSSNRSTFQQGSSEKIKVYISRLEKHWKIFNGARYLFSTMQMAHLSELRTGH